MQFHTEVLCQKECMSCIFASLNIQDINACQNCLAFSQKEQLKQFNKLKFYAFGILFYVSHLVAVFLE